MKNLLILAFFSTILWSCESANRKETTSAYFNFELEIDTVQLDSRNEIIMAGAYMDNPAVSFDKTKFYNFDNENYVLEVFDIENYKLDKKVNFQKDGPNGLGSNQVRSLKIFPNGNIGIEDFESFKVFDLQGNQVKNVNFNKDWIKGDFTASESFEFASVNKDGSLIAGMHFGTDNFKPLMFLLDIEEKKAKRILLSQFDKLKRYKIVFRRNGGYLTDHHERVQFGFKGDSIIISNSAYNDLYIYNEKTNELEYRTFAHKLIPERKEKEYKNSSESREEVVEIIYSISEEVRFTEFFWDEDTRKFYRFTNQTIYDDKRENSTYKVSMLVYDEYLQLIGEKELMKFKDYAEPLFVKDGKVHFHLNMEDELGFIRIGLKN
ncbi:protein of unknown function [Marivirga sericea]|uniref:TolB-like 6-blade propeller-like n=1 Tax=Marivirga sericea TaxID=1028 RepID=A0A1X7I9R6_9BACT|nr:DUF4221 family protein [Marivirga sericea]SMG10854.1 protein of unknown function [Marivirga sericea]